MAGGAILGNRAIGSWTSATIPTITMRMEMTIATMGRLMKKRAINPSALFGRWRGRGRGLGFLPVRLRLSQLWLHGHPALDLLETSRHNLFPFRDPLLDDPEAVDPLPDFHRTNLDGVLRLDHCHLIRALQFGHRPLRHQEGALDRRGRRSDLCI